MGKCRCVHFTRLSGGHRNLSSCSCPSITQHDATRLRTNKPKESPTKAPLVVGWVAPQTQAWEARPRRDLISADAVGETQSKKEAQSLPNCAHTFCILVEKGIRRSPESSFPGCSQNTKLSHTASSVPVPLFLFSHSFPDPTGQTQRMSFLPHAF